MGVFKKQKQNSWTLSSFVATRTTHMDMSAVKMRMAMSFWDDPSDEATWHRLKTIPKEKLTDS